LALTGLFRAKWSNAVHEEWITNLLKNRPDITRQKLERTRRLMDKAALDALVEGYEDLIPSLSLPDKNDRHVLAAAIRGEAQVIVTMNLKDFPNEILQKYEIEAQHPDEHPIWLVTGTFLTMPSRNSCIAPSGVSPVCKVWNEPFRSKFRAWLVSAAFCSARWARNIWLCAAISNSLFVTDIAPPRTTELSHSLNLSKFSLQICGYQNPIMPVGNGVRCSYDTLRRATG
jgi:hypothetical protein